MSENSVAITKWYKTKKGKIIIGVAVAAIAAITTTIIVLNNKKKKEQKKLDDGQSKQDGINTTTNAGANPQTQTPSSTPKKSDNTAPKSKEYSKSELPNNGVGCGDVKTNFDRQYDYVKCNGDWYAISKDRTNGKLPAWTSLTGKPNAISLLDNKFKEATAESNTNNTNAATA